MRTILLVAMAVIGLRTAAAGSDPAFDPAKICASVYQPVCASKAGESRTFPNACLSKGAGFTPASQGACGSGKSLLPRFCSKQHGPVCGERQGVRRGFGNECEARAQDFTVLRDGDC